jgi:hypothetical protein
MKFFSGNRPTASLLVMLAAVLLLAQTALYGQATGTVTGIVADTTGAVIPKASVVLSDLATGIKRTAISNGDGAFAFAGVTPDTNYRLDVSAPNFEPWESQAFAVQAGAQLSYTDIRMKVGTTASAVTVEAQVDSNLASLDTAERSDIITAKDLNTLTIVGRDATELVRMLPGYSMSTGDQGLYNRPGYNTAVVGLSGPTGAFSANGAGVTGIAVVTDGVSLTDIASNSGSVQTINIDMIQEVKATSSSYGAQLAKGPAVISADSKKGGSTYHGEAYMAVRNTVFNSNDWYDNYLRQSRPAGAYYYPGGNFGGPLPLPFTQFNRGRNKLFFFVGYEYDKQQFEANQQAISSWVPTVAERQGDFSAASLDAELCGARPDGNANPNSIQAMCNVDSYLPNGAIVPNNNAAPFANAAGVALLNWFPAPNADPFTNPFGYNYIQQKIQNQNVSMFKSTLDFEINDTNKLFLVYGLQKEIDEDPVALNQSFPSGAIPYPGQITTGDISNVASANYEKIFGSTVTNDLIAAMSFVSLPGKMGDPTAVDRFDIPGNSGSGFNYLGMYKNGGDLSVPAINGNNGNGYPNVVMPGGFWNNQVHTKKVDPILQDNVSWQKGTHFLEFGAYWETGTFNGTADSNAYPQGQYTFNPGNGYFEYSGGNSSAFGEAQFIPCRNPSTLGTLRLSGANYLGSCFNPTAMMYEGYADSYQQANFTPLVDMRYTTLAGFVNDTWKLHNLTLILGARIEHLGPWADRHNNGLATFSDSLYTSECGGYTRNCVSQAMPGISWDSQHTGVSNSVNSPPTVYFSPRVGASWDAFGKRNTVLRGGWGIYRNQEQFNPYALAAATAQNYKTSQLIGALTFAQIDSESPLNPPDFTAYTLSPGDNVRPIYYQYNGGIDQSLGGIRFLHFGPSHLSVAYVGSHNVNLGSYNNSSYNSASDINIICGIETGCPANNNPNIPTGQDSLFQVALGSLPTAMTSVQGVGGGISSLDTPETDFFRPYPFYQHVYRLKHDFYSNYNSAQIEWDKNAGMVTFGANYTFAKNLATAASYNNNLVDPVNLRNDYNPVSYDRSQVFNIHYLVDIGRRYRGGNRLIGLAANGWQVSGVSQVMSGFPLASENGQNFGFGYGNVLPVQVTYSNQTSPSQEVTPCHTEYGIQADSNGNTYCVTSMNPTVWLGTPDVQLMPTLVKGVSIRGGPKTHQFINPLALGLPEPGTNGAYRLPYIHGPAYLDHDLTVLKNVSMGEGRNLQLRMAAFNVFNHPLVSFNNQNTNNLNLAFQNATVGSALTQNVLTYQDFGVADIKVGNRLAELEAKFTF